MAFRYTIQCAECLYSLSGYGGGPSNQHRIEPCEGRVSTRRRLAHSEEYFKQRRNSGVNHAMAMIAFEEGAIQVDATIVAKGLGIDPSLVQERMREGAITSLCERGHAEDIGRYRLTFFSLSRRFRLIVDEGGNVISRSAIDFSDRPLPASARRPGV